MRLQNLLLQKSSSASLKTLIFLDAKGGYKLYYAQKV